MVEGLASLASTAATQLSAWADAAFPQLELLARRLGAAARPYLRLLSSAYEEVPDELVGCLTAVFALWILLSSARLYFSGGGAAAGSAAGSNAEAKAEAEAEAGGKEAGGKEAGGKGSPPGDAKAEAEAGGKEAGGKEAGGKGSPPGDAKAEAEEAAGGAKAAQAEAAPARTWGPFEPLRSAIGAIDKRLELYEAQIALAVWIARLAVGASLFAYGIAAKFGVITFREYFNDGSLSAADVAEAEAFWVRFSSTAGVGLSVVVLLPALLPMPKDRQRAPPVLHPADELLRS